MNALRRPVQHRKAARALWALTLLTAGQLVARPARADDTSAPEIVAARELFRQGTEDVDAGRYAAALEKFRQVAAVKETANVRFNIARCEEALGKTGAALADFEQAEREAKPGADEHADVASLARDRADVLRLRVPRLVITAPAPAPDGLAVTLDGAKLALGALGVPLPVDPGAHVIDATAPGRAPFHAEVAIREREAQTLAIALGAGDPGAGAAGERTAAGDSSSRRAWGGVTLGVSGALAATSVVFLLLHNGAVSDVESACPGDRCPASSQASVTGHESTSRTDETLSVVFAGAAVIGAGVGLYLVLGAPSSPTAASAVVTPGGFSLSGRF